MSKPQILTTDQMIKLLRKKIGEKSIKDAAVEFGISFQFLYHVLDGTYEVGPKLAGILGYQQMTSFRRLPRLARGLNSKAPKRPKAPRQAKA